MKEQMTEKERMLWKMAKKRVAFRRHLATYIIINGFLWALCFFAGENDHERIPWPVWPTMGWGIGVLFNFYDAYFNQVNSVEKEYEKLKNSGK